MAFVQGRVVHAHCKALLTFLQMAPRHQPGWVCVRQNGLSCKKKKKKNTWFFSGPANLNQTEAPPRQQFVVTAISRPPSTNCYSHHRRGLLLLLLPRKKKKQPSSLYHFSQLCFISAVLIHCRPAQVQEQLAVSHDTPVSVLHLFPSL